MAKRRFRCFDIDWDTDGEEAGLPEEMVIEVDVDMAHSTWHDIEKQASDKLTEETGFCHNGFQMERL